MNEKLREELKEDCETGSLYDFVANHYWELSKEELADILKESLFVSTDGMTDEEKADLNGKILDSIKENTNLLSED